MNNKNGDNSVQTSTDNQDISCDCNVSLLSNHCSQNDTSNNNNNNTMYTNSHSVNILDVYNKNQCDLCRNGSSQVDNPISNNQNSTCHHHALFEINNSENSNSAKRSRALNGSLISLEDNNDSLSKVVTDQFVQQQVSVYTFWIIDGPFSIFTKVGVYKTYPLIVVSHSELFYCLIVYSVV